MTSNDKFLKEKVLINLRRVGQTIKEYNSADYDHVYNVYVSPSSNCKMEVSFCCPDSDYNLNYETKIWIDFDNKIMPFSVFEEFLFIFLTNHYQWVFDKMAFLLEKELSIKTEKVKGLSELLDKY